MWVCHRNDTSIKRVHAVRWSATVPHIISGSFSKAPLKPWSSEEHDRVGELIHASNAEFAAEVADREHQK
eukprot:SAG22_NODE_655_length_8104_cov_6.498438_7_plen_70_part_00